jgi:hypothetical protein
MARFPNFGGKFKDGEVAVEPSGLIPLYQTKVFLKRQGVEYYECSDEPFLSSTERI